jgi:hypothetical protein
MAFWLFPLLAYAPYTTSYSHVWIIKNWQEILPPILWIPTGVALATLLIHVGLAAFGVRPFPKFLGLVWWATGIGILFYYTAKAFHVVDIRFFPFMQLGFCLCAAVGLGCCSRCCRRRRSGRSSARSRSRSTSASRSRSSRRG